MQVLPSGHVHPHPPQFFGSLLSSTHTLAQFARGDGHAKPLHQPLIALPPQHAPPWHDVALAGHTAKQPPQFFKSPPFWVSMHRSPQQVNPRAHPVWRQPVVLVHSPPEQACPGAHAWPQMPQLLGSLFSSTHMLAQFTRLDGQTLPLHATGPPGVPWQQPPP
jgi:hypothetical protein